MDCLQNPKSLYKCHASFFRHGNISFTRLGCPEMFHGFPTAFSRGWVPEYLWWRGVGSPSFVSQEGRYMRISIVGSRVAFCGPSANCAVAESRKTGQVLGTSRHQQTVSGGPCRWAGRTKATHQPLLWNDKGMHWEASQVIDSTIDLCRSPRMQVNHLWFILMVRMGKARTFAFVPFLLK